MVSAIDVCATGCTKSPCGLEGMDVKGVSTKGGRIPVGLDTACPGDDGRTVDATCKAVATADGKFSHRLLCKKDCDNAYKCKEPS